MLRPRICELFDTKTPKEYTLANQKIYDDWSSCTDKLPTVLVPRGTRCPTCYLCNVRMKEIHWFYHFLCDDCGEAAYLKRNLTADLTGQKAIVTGGRLKLGYQIVLKLLRAGASVMVTSRNWENALDRYKEEPDYDEWKNRLHICRLSFDLLTVDQLLPTFEAELNRIWPDDYSIDIFIQNAAQTIAKVNERKRKVQESEDLDEAERPKKIPRLTLFDKSPSSRRYPPQIWAENIFPKADRYQRVLEERTENTWNIPFGQVQSEEAKEVMLANAWAPFVLNQFLLPRLLASKYKPYIIHVHAKEGHFNSHKTLAHMHTNMAKAALSMITRCLALQMSTYSGRQQYQAAYKEELPWAKRYSKMPFLGSQIQHRGRNEHISIEKLNVHGVDPGWFSVDEYTLEARMKKNLFFSPIDEIDAASRVVYPIFIGASSFPGTWRHYIPLVNF
jgi:NAD(P)-dependent dehydrogenase (short-subunit alcohol dehydrogenase family)